LIGRKLSGTNGESMDQMLSDIDVTIRDARSTNNPQLVQIADRLQQGRDALIDASNWMIETLRADKETALASATAYLGLAGDVIGGHFLTRSTVGTPSDEGAARARRLALAGFYAETALAEAPGHVSSIIDGGRALSEGSDVLFDLS